MLQGRVGERVIITLSNESSWLCKITEVWIIPSWLITAGFIILIIIIIMQAQGTMDNFQGSHKTAVLEGTDIYHRQKSIQNTLVLLGCASHGQDLL